MSHRGSQGVHTLGNNVSATKILIEKHKMFMNLVGNILASRETNLFAQQFFHNQVGKHENI
jgi:hypothetical protein